MQPSRSALFIPAVLLLCGGFVACSSANSPNGPSSNTTSTSTTTTGGGQNSALGTVTVRLKDSPFSDASALLVTFSEVSIHSADTGEWTNLDFDSGMSRTCDLTRLKDETDVLGVGTLTGGQYTQIRLNVTSASIYFDSAQTTGDPCAADMVAPTDGTNAPVTVPSGEVKLSQEFTVPTAGGTTITLDFDGDQSIHQTGNSNGRGNAPTKYIMTPVIRVVSVQ
jgi:hypothetical protein